MAATERERKKGRSLNLGAVATLGSVAALDGVATEGATRRVLGLEGMVTLGRAAALGKAAVGVERGCADEVEGFECGVGAALAGRGGEGGIECRLGRVETELIEIEV